MLRSSLLPILALAAIATAPAGLASPSLTCSVESDLPDNLDETLHIDQDDGTYTSIEVAADGSKTLRVQTLRCSENRANGTILCVSEPASDATPAADVSTHYIIPKKARQTVLLTSTFVSNASAHFPGYSQENLGTVVTIPIRCDEGSDL